MGFPALGAFFGFTNHYVIAIRTGDRTSDEQEVVRFADLDDLQVLSRAADLAHMAGHFHPAHNGAGEQALADGARTAMPALGAVGRVTTGEPVTLDDTFETAALHDADRIDEIAGREQQIGRAHV